MNKYINYYNYIVKYGSYAKPLLNSIIYNKKLNDKSWNYLFKAMICTWENKYGKAAKEVEKGFKNLPNNKFQHLYFLLLKQKMNIHYELKDHYTTNEIWQILYINQHHIDPLIRTNIIIALNNIGNRLNKKRIRYWGHSYEEQLHAKTYVLLYESKKFVKNKNYKEAVGKFAKAYNTAKKIPHISGMITSLNNAAWYANFIDKKQAQKYAEIMLQNILFYKEENSKLLNYLDTYLFVNNKNQRFLYFNGNLIKLLYDKSPPKKQEKLKHIKELVTDYIVDYNISKYRKDEELYFYLNNVIKNSKDEAKKIGLSYKRLQDILTEKTEYIKGNTIQKIIKGLKLTNVEKMPKPFKNELAKMFLNDYFYKSIEKLKTMSKQEIDKRLIATYMSGFRDKKYKYNVINNIRNNISNMEKLKDTKDFFTVIVIIKMVYNDNFLSYRKKAILDFINSLDKQLQNVLFEKYIKLSEQRKKILDIFIRNYERTKAIDTLSNNTLFDVAKTAFTRIDIIKKFSKKYQLNYYYVYTSFWYFNKQNDRTELLNILENL